MNEVGVSINWVSVLMLCYCEVLNYNVTGLDTEILIVLREIVEEWMDGDRSPYHPLKQMACRTAALQHGQLATFLMVKEIVETASTMAININGVNKSVKGFLSAV